MLDVNIPRAEIIEMEDSDNDDEDNDNDKIGKYQRYIQLLLIIIFFYILKIFFLQWI